MNKEYSTDELNKKLAKAGANARVNQIQVNQFQANVTKIRLQAEKYKFELKNDIVQLEAKRKQREELEKKQQITKERLQANEEKAALLNTQLQACAATFSSTIAFTRNTTQKTGNTVKRIQGQVDSADLAAKRGYSCKAKSIVP